uniref:Ribonuclease E n=1 Tax=Yamadaella caenomyce TaxID=259029 RepID=A0A1G4NYH6_9FLOR|nr:Ribonuclease E [Yamadaella caenomyce]SCW23708.1 Ribonuclease E [Yamadaella caenomyce]
MVKKIIISKLNDIAAIIQDSKIQELIVINNTYQLHDIYLGIVQKIFTSINAAFIQLNHEAKSGFIHVNDVKYLYNHLSTNPYPDINQVLSIKQQLLVQIIKEPTPTKGPRLTTNIHLSGRYIILMPLNNTICIGQNIYDENERHFLKALGILIKPRNMGILFKTTAAGVSDELLIEEVTKLKSQWNFIEKSVVKIQPPHLIHYNRSLVHKIIREYIDRSNTIIISDCVLSLKQIYECYHDDIYGLYNAKVRFKLYKENKCILEAFQVNSLIFHILQPRVELTSGIYIFIESSEALTTIDVNSGSFNQYGKSQDSLLKTNCLAAKEIAYQLKVRNIHGIIIIDFIDMKSRRDQLLLLEHFYKAMKHDEAKPEIIQLSALGLVEVTRRRKGQSIVEIFTNTSTVENEQCIYDTRSNNGICDTNIQKRDINGLFFQDTFINKIRLIKESTTRILKEFVDLQSVYTIPVDLYYSLID